MKSAFFTVFTLALAEQRQRWAKRWDLSTPRGHGARPCWPSCVPPRSRQKMYRLHVRTSLRNYENYEFYYTLTLEFGHFQHPVMKWEMPKIDLLRNEGQRPSRAGKPHCGRELAWNQPLPSCG